MSMLKSTSKTEGIDMKKAIIIIAILLMLAGLGAAELIQPNADLLTKGSDGAYKVIVPGWGGQVNIINGVAAIGSVGKAG
jgi:hypothetical protein